MDVVSGRGGGSAGGLLVAGVGASAGGLRALERFVEALPAGLPAAIVVVLHVDRHHPSLLAQLLSRRTPLRVKEARHGDRLQPGCIYVAPPDRHVLVGADETLALSKGELVHYVRPSADVLFSSLAECVRERAVAIVLTGTGRDGAAGIDAVKRAGGTVIAQDEASSEFFAMPDAAIRTGGVDFILPLDEIAPKLVALAAAAKP